MKRPWCEQGCEPYAELYQAVDHQRATGEVRPPTTDEAADGKAAHEGGQHRAYRVDRHAEGQAQEPDPGDLVDQAGGAGGEEQAGDGGRRNGCGMG